MLQIPSTLEAYFDQSTLNVETLMWFERETDLGRFLPTILDSDIASYARVRRFPLANGKMASLYFAWRGNRLRPDRWFAFSDDNEFVNAGAFTPGSPFAFQNVQDAIDLTRETQTQKIRNLIDPYTLEQAEQLPRHTGNLHCWSFEQEKGVTWAAVPQSVQYLCSDGIERPANVFLVWKGEKLWMASVEFVFDGLPLHDQIVVPTGGN